MNTTDAVESEAEVPGGTLRYRIAGRTDAGRWLVFENGWSASFPYAVWLERALAPHWRVLSYDRAGVGESRRTESPTPELLTRQLLALLEHLKIREPVVVAGHSQGGLMAALHAAQAPAAIRSIVQIDPTPDVEDPRIDRLVGVILLMARFARLCVRLRLPDPLFSAVAAEPGEAAERLSRSCRSLPSISAAVDELKLLPAVRAAVAACPEACPRLVLSAAATRKSENRLLRLLGGEAAAQRTVDAMEELNRRQVAWNAASRWESLPYDHAGLVTTPAGAADVAARIFAFER